MESWRLNWRERCIHPMESVALPLKQIPFWLHLSSCFCFWPRLCDDMVRVDWWLSLQIRLERIYNFRAWDWDSRKPYISKTTKSRLRWCLIDWLLHNACLRWCCSTIFMPFFWILRIHVLSSTYIHVYVQLIRRLVIKPTHEIISGTRSALGYCKCGVTPLRHTHIEGVSYM